MGVAGGGTRIRRDAPVAIYLTRFSGSYDLLHAGFAIPVVAGLAVAALVLSRRARRRTSRLTRRRKVRARDRGPRPRHRRPVHGRRQRSSRSASTGCSSTSARGAERSSSGSSTELIASTMPAFMFDIGSSLREARIRQDLDFPELEERTKIRPKYLRALEDERFDILPAPTYVRGFLRSYAEALGLDGQPFVDEYNSRFTVGEDDAPLRARRAPPPRRERGPRESRIAAVALVAIAIATALVIAAWKFGGPERREGSRARLRSGRGRVDAEGEGDGTARRARERRELVDGGAPDVVGREAPLQRDARAGSAEVVRGEEPPARAREAAERARPTERQPRRPSERVRRSS